MRIILVSVLLLLVQTSFSQSIDAYVSSFVNQKKYEYPVKKWYNSDDTLKLLLKKIKKYTKSKEQRKRYLSYKLIAKCGKNTNNIKQRKLAVNMLVKGLQDEEISIKKKCGKELSKFRKDDFEKKSKAKIELLLHSKKVTRNTILLAGWLGDVSFSASLDTIRNRKVSTKLERRQQWSANLALARMYDQVAVNSIQKVLKRQKINSRILHAIGKDIIYTRHPDLYQWLIDILNSDEKNCNSFNPNTSEKVMCAYRAMELLAPAIEGFPVRTDKWGDLEIDDYESALKNCREWLFENMNAYEIHTHLY